MSEFPKSSNESTEQRDTVFKTRLEDMRAMKSSEAARIEEIRAWQTQEEKLVPKNPEGEISYSARIAEMKLAAGFLDDAWNDFYDAIDCARGHGRDDIADKIRARMKELDSEDI